MSALNASKTIVDNKIVMHCADVQILHLCMCGCWGTDITTLDSSSSVMGRPSALIIKIWHALWVEPTSLCRRTCLGIPLKQLASQSAPLGDKYLWMLWDLFDWSTSTGRGTSSVCISPGLLFESSSSFCFLRNVRCWQMGQTMLSLMFPSVLMLSSVLTRQSWQNTCPQLRVLSVPERLS